MFQQERIEISIELYCNYATSLSDQLSRQGATSWSDFNDRFISLGIKCTDDAIDNSTVGKEMLAETLGRMRDEG